MITFKDFHTPIVELYQKQAIEIYYLYSKENWFIVDMEIRNILEHEQHDSIKYFNGVWYGVTPNHNKRNIAHLDQPELTDLTFPKLIELIDFKYHILKTIRGNHINTYTKIYITSKYSLKQLFPRQFAKYHTILSNWITFIEY